MELTKITQAKQKQKRASYPHKHSKLLYISFFLSKKSSDNHNNLRWIRQKKENVSIFSASTMFYINIFFVLSLFPMH